MKKVFKIITLILILVAIVVAGYFAIIKFQEKKILSIVDEIFVSIKNGDTEKIRQYIDFEQIEKEERTLKNFTKDTEIEKNIMKNLTYEVVEKETKLNNCKIKLNISNKDFKVIITNYFKKAFTLAFSQVFGGKKEEELKKELDQYLIEQFDSESISMITSEVEIEVLKKDGAWTINYDKEKVINAIIPGYKDVADILNK